MRNRRAGKTHLGVHERSLAGAAEGVLRVVRPGWHYVYLVRARDGSFYCGYARNPRARLRAHNAGTGAKALRGRIPATLAYVRRFANKGAALRFEAALKKLPHERKAALARHWIKRRQPD